MEQVLPDFLPIRLSHKLDILVERNSFHRLRILGQLEIHELEMIARTNEYDRQEPNQLCFSSKSIRCQKRIHIPFFCKQTTGQYESLMPTRSPSNVPFLYGIGLKQALSWLVLLQ